MLDEGRARLSSAITWLPKRETNIIFDVRNQAIFVTEYRSSFASASDAHWERALRGARRAIMEQKKKGAGRNKGMS